MHRRTFVKSVALGTLTLGANGRFQGRNGVLAGEQRQAASDRPEALRMRVGCQRWGSDPRRLGFLLRCGVRDICISPAKDGPDKIWTVETCRAARKAVEQAGLRVASMYWGVPIHVLVPNRRDPLIERCGKQIVAAGRAGIPCLAYNLHVRTWRARTGRVPGRGGATYTAWELAKTEKQPHRPDIGPVTADELWDRISYFLERVVPVATEAKVRLACHPSDPPVPDDNPWKIDEVLDSVEGLKRFVTIAESPYHGLTFCQGSIWEMLSAKEKPHALYDAIEWFGSRGKIFQVHFRNLRGTTTRFAETYHDEGDIDMAQAVMAFKRVGYNGVIMPDHVPHHEDDPEELQHFAHAYGYIKGLIAAYAVDPA